jgi:HAD superfamily hydrolase (TIGR01509 family)
VARPAALLDLDGTLVDTNYHHAIAWYRAFRQNGIVLPFWRCHRAIGMGGDKLVAALAGEQVERELGDAVRAAEKVLYLELIHETEPFADARRFVEELKRRGHVVVLASSAKQHELDHYLDVVGVRELVDGWTSAADVEATKPDPDLVEAALDKAGTRDAVMVGDTPWDCEAAARAEIETVTVLTGGFCEQELRHAGAVCVFESMGELLDALDATPLGRGG